MAPVPVNVTLVFAQIVVAEELAETVGVGFTIMLCVAELKQPPALIPVTV